MSAASNVSSTVSSSIPSNVPPNLRQAALELLEAARALGVAVDDEDLAALRAASERRATAFARLQALVGESPPEALRPLLREVAAIDAVTLGTARGDLERVRGLLSEVAAARRAARALQSDKPAPRFVARRV